MLLSIGMIVRNEEKYLRRCLEALKPILDNVDSELIIVDTGSDDGTVDIAREFTDLVYHFEWCDDFSAARNAALKRAKGKWYMSIDADEILEDPAEIIEFFNSGEYKRYKSAAYIIRSVNEAESKTGADMNSIRLIELSADSYYVNAVHEKFYKTYGPTKYTNVVANHFGYVTENNKEHIDFKMKRNNKILFSELEKNPENSMLYLYIGNSFALMKDFDSALEYYGKGKEITKLRNTPVKYSLYASLAGIYYQTKRYNEAVAVADEYFGLKKDEIGTDIEMYMIKATSCLLLKKNDDSKYCYEKYIECFRKYRQGHLRTVDTFQHSVNFTNNSAYLSAILNLSKLLITDKQYGDAEKYLLSEPDLFAADNEHYTGWLLLRFELMQGKGDFSGLAGLYKGSTDAGKSILQNQIESIIGNTDSRDAILREFASLDASPDTYERLLNLRYKFDHSLPISDSASEFLENVQEWTPLYADAVYFALVSGTPVNAISSIIDSSMLSSYFFNNAFYHYPDLPYYVVRIMDSGMDDAYAGGIDIISHLWLSVLFLNELISKSIRSDSVYDLFRAYAKSIGAYLSAVIKPEILNEEKSVMLPKQWRAGFFSSLAVDAYDKGRTSDYIKYLKSALLYCPELVNAINLLTVQLENRLNKASSINAEFQAYAEKVKNAISGFIMKGLFKEAEQILATYEKLCPDDTDIPLLKEQILSGKQNM